MENLLLSEEFLRKLEHLSIIAKRIHRSSTQGLERTYRKGSSLEFQDHRAYNPGDDLRSIDWNVWARLGKLFIKLFSAEEDRTVYLLVDTSLSMGTGDPPKLSYAVQAAAALAYIAGSNQDRVGVSAFDKSYNLLHRPSKGISQMLSLFKTLSSLKAAESTGINSSLTHFSRSTRRSGIAVVCSDLLDPGGYTEGLLSLLYNKFEIILLHILSEEDINPTCRGALKIQDVETGESINLTMDPSLAKAYREVLEKYLTDIESFCISRGIEYLRVSSSIPFEDLILKYLRQGRYIR